MANKRGVKSATKTETVEPKADEKAPAYKVYKCATKGCTYTESAARTPTGPCPKCFTPDWAAQKK